MLLKTSSHILIRFSILSQFDFDAEIVLLAANMFPTAKPIIHQSKEFEGVQQEKRRAGAVSVFHLPQ